MQRIIMYTLYRCRRGRRLSHNQTHTCQIKFDIIIDGVAAVACTKQNEISHTTAPALTPSNPQRRRCAQIT